jgi:hypothetical protein
MCGSRPSAPPAPQYIYLPAPAAPKDPDPEESGLPDYGNSITKSMKLPNNGLATIESVSSSSASGNAPTLGDPMGEGSQRVQRQKAKLAIAQ